MDIPKNNNMTLDSIPANRKIIEKLYSHNLISADARKYGLELLYPTHKWSLWIARMLLVFGISLILSGIFYFAAFNWIKIKPEIKLVSTQVSILICLIASYFYGLQSLPGKIFLLISSIIVGTFLVVFGQYYQTGADSYNLFTIWALLILPWVIISDFAALWMVWLVISNIALYLYWIQAASPEYEMELMIFSYLALFNLLFLGLREYFLIKGMYWLKKRWTRLVLIPPILFYVFIPTLTLIVTYTNKTLSVFLGALLSVIIHGAFYIVYRFKFPDILVLSATILSVCIISVSVIFRILILYGDLGVELRSLLMGFISIVTFYIAIIALKIIAKQIRGK